MTTSVLGIRNRQRVKSAVQEIATDLREVAIAADEGACLGTEGHLADFFDVSVPTLRQAARIVESEQLLFVKRGVQGGYFVRRPDSGAASRLAGIYLRGDPKSREDVSKIVEILTPLIIEQIISAPDLTMIEGFAHLDGRECQRPEPGHVDGQFMMALMGLIESRPLRLIVETFFNFAMTIPRDGEQDTPEMLKELQAVRVDLARALLRRNRDDAIACALARHHLVERTVATNLKSTDSRVKSQIVRQLIG